jgi:hypothetical protein
LPLTGLGNSLELTRQAGTAVIVLIGVVALLVWLFTAPHSLTDIIGKFRP